MAESLRNFRTTYTDVEEHSGEEVNIYMFLENAIEIPDEPDNGDWASKMSRYRELHFLIESARKKRQKPAVRDIEEKQQLHAELDAYLNARFKQRRKSILKVSMSVPRRPHAEGKDSQVYYYGSAREFLANPDTPRYVSKYSHPERDVSSANIVYLRKKYQMLHKLMGQHIPRAWFIAGEFRHGIPKHEEGKFHTSLRAITIQREIRGQTFTEMTPSVRRGKRVQQALKAALAEYRATRQILRDACDAVGVPHKAFEMSLDIGAASAEKVNTPFNPLTYASPNVMYDQRKKRVFFIDMGWGEWTPEKEKVFNYIMGGKHRKTRRRVA